MKTEVNVSFNYGAWSIQFEKEFDLPFAPFYGLTLFEEANDIENSIELVSDDYCKTRIYYYVETNSFYVDVMNIWKSPVRADVIDETIETFIKTHWMRTDREDLDALKELMNRDRK